MGRKGKIGNDLGIGECSRSVSIPSGISQGVVSDGGSVRKRILVGLVGVDPPAADYAPLGSDRRSDCALVVELQPCQVMCALISASAVSHRDRADPAFEALLI